MTNEELTIAVQGGEVEKLPVLWQKVERFIKKMANRYSCYNGGFADFDDLYNSGYIAFVRAIETYKPGTNMSFISWLFYFLKREFKIARYGGASEKATQDPLNYAASLDAPFDDGDLEGGTLNDIVPDSKDDMLEAEDRLYNENIRHDLEEAISQLPELSQEIIRAKYFGDATLSQIAREFDMNDIEVRGKYDQAMRKLRHPIISRKLRQYIDEQTNFYARTGFSSFDHSGGSSVEWAAIDRENMEKDLTGAQNIQIVF